MTDFLALASRSFIPNVLLGGLLFLVFSTLHDFLPVLVWAFVISFIAWTPYQSLRRLLNGNATVSALLMTSIIAAVIFLLLYWLAELLQNEIKIAYITLTGSATQQVYQLPDSIRRIPGLGNYLQEWLERLNNDRAGVLAQFAGWAKQWLGQFAKLLGGLGGYVMKFGFVFITVFFYFRDGEQIIAQLRLGLAHFLGSAHAVYLQTIGDTTRAVVYGLVFAAMGQGIMAGIGYAVVGIKAPVLFGALTTVMGLIPMGANLVWVPICLMLVLTNQLWLGVGLAFWGFLVISKIDDLIRLVIISGANRIPFLIALFGIFGGLSAFGLIGVFVGPVVLRLLLAVWHVWAEQRALNFKQ